MISPEEQIIIYDPQVKDSPVFLVYPLYQDKDVIVGNAVNHTIQPEPIKVVIFKDTGNVYHNENDVIRYYIATNK